MAKILMPAGAQNVPIGTAVAVLVEEEGDIAAFKDYAGGAPAAAAPPAEGGAASQAGGSSTEWGGRGAGGVEVGGRPRCMR